jgi:hypothetical protein
METAASLQEQQGPAPRQGQLGERCGCRGWRGVSAGRGGVAWGCLQGRGVQQWRALRRRRCHVLAWWAVQLQAAERFSPMACCLPLLTWLRSVCWRAGSR